MVEISPSDIETTSDRLHLNLDTATEIPLAVITQLRYLRSHQIILEPPSITIVNTHAECSMNLETEIPIETIAAYAAGKIQTTDYRTMKIEPALETLDLYALDEQTQTTQRLRFYLQDGTCVSTRIITTGLSQTQEDEWIHENSCIKARSECVLVQRDDMPETDLVGKWIGWRYDSYVAVHKKVLRANFGIERMWDHRSVFYKDQKNQVVDATSEESVLGMGPYIAVSFQDINLGKTQSLNSQTLSSIIISINAGKLSVLDIQTLIGHTPTSSKRVEVECKGPNYKQEGAYLIRQLTDLTNDLGIDYKFARSRKISSQTKS